MINIGSIVGTLSLEDLFSGPIVKAERQLGRSGKAIKSSLADLQASLNKLSKTPSLRADAAASAKALAAIKAQNRAIQESINAHVKGIGAVRGLNNEREIAARLLSIGVTRESAYGKQIEQQIRLQQQLKAQLDKVNVGKERAIKNANRLADGFKRLLVAAGLVLSLRAIARGFVAIVNASKDFESSFAGIRKTVNATEEQYAQLSRGMRELSKTIPVNVNELNRIGEAAGQLGIKREAILGFTRVIADLGATTDLVGDQAASDLARIANIVSLPQTQFDRLGSTIVDLGNTLATNESKIVNFTLRIAGVGKIAGLTVAQIAAIGGAMSSVGVEAESGGTSVQKVLINMTQAVASGGKQLQIFAKTAGLSASDFASAFREDAGRAFTLFVEGLGKQGTNAFNTLKQLGLNNQRVIQSFLSLAGAGDLLSRSMEIGTTAFSENTALAKEAEQRYKTFASQVQISRNKLNDLFITAGDQMVPALIEMNKWLGDLATSADFKEFARDFGENVSGVIRDALAVVKFFVQNIGTLKVALVALIALRVHAWAMTVVAGFRAAAAAGVTFQLSLGPIIAGLVALGVAAHEAIERWRKSSENGTESIIAANNRAKESVRQLREELSKGLVSGKTFQEVVNRSAQLGIQIQNVEGSISSLKSKLDDLHSGRAGLQADAYYNQQVKLTKALEDEEGKLQNLKLEMVSVDRQLKKVKGTTIEWKDGIEGAGGATDDTIEDTNNLSGSVGDLSKKLESLFKDLSTNIVQQRFLAEAAEKGEQALADATVTVRLWNAALSKGIDPLSALGRRLIQYELKLIEYENRLTLAANAVESLAAVEQDLNDILDERAGLPSLPDPILFLDEDPNKFANFGEKLNEIWKNSAESMQRSFSTAFTNIIRSGSLDFKDFFSNLADIGISIFVEQLSAALMASLEGYGNAWKDLLKSMGDFASTNAGKLALGIGTISTIAAADNQGYAAIGAALGAAVGAGLAAYFTGGMGAGQGALWGAQIGAWLGSMIKKGAPKFFATLEGELGQIDFEGSLARLAPGIGTELEAGISKIVSFLGGEFRSLASGITFETRKGMKVVIDGIAHYFEEGDWASGIQFAIVEAIKRSDIAHISADARAVLQNTMADTMEELFSDLDFAKFMEQLNLSDAAIQLDNFVDEFFQIWNRMVELGIDGAQRLEQWAVNSLQAQRNSILGIVESDAERIRSQSETFNAQVKLIEAEQLARRADLLVRQAELQATAEFVKAHGNLVKTGLEIDAFRLKGEGGILKGKLALLEATNQALKAIEVILATLPNLIISQTDIDTAIRRIGSGGGKAKQAIAEVTGLLEQSVTNFLPEMSRSLLEINNRWDEAALKVKKNASLLKQIAEAREREIQALRDQLRLEVQPFLPTLQGSAVGPGGNLISGSIGQWEDRAQEIIDWADRIVEANRLLLEQTGQAALTVAEIVAAANERMRLLVEDAIGSLNLPLENTRASFQSLGDTLRFLDQQVNEGILSHERYASIIAQVADQQLLALGDNLVGFLDRYYGNVEGFENFRLQLEQTRFQLELANLRLQFQLVRDLGLLTRETIAMIEGVFNFIDNNLPTFPNLPVNVTPISSHPGFTGSNTNNVFEERARVLEALQDIFRSVMDPYQRDLLELTERFDEYRRVLGNTADVQRAWNIAFGQLNERYTRSLREFLTTLRDPALTPQQNIETLRQRFLTLASTGGIGQSDELLRLAEQLRTAYGQAYGTAGGGFQALLDLIQASINSFLARGGIDSIRNLGADMGNVLQFPTSTAVSSVSSNVNPVAAQVNTSNTILNRVERVLQEIEYNTDRTTEEVRRGNQESINSRRIAHVDSTKLADSFKAHRVRVA